MNKNNKSSFDKTKKFELELKTINETLRKC